MIFDYDRAFSRNAGWVTREEQQSLRRARVAIAGAGGVGGEYLITLCRMGIGRFHISDFDHFELHNFNRQAGAFMSTLGLKKSAVMASAARDINPETDVVNFDDGISADNIDAFLEGVDIYVDALDIFAMSARCLVFEHCHRKGIPVITVAPMGMGAALLCFLPGGMTYEEYFCFDNAADELEVLIRFLVGVSPSFMQSSYLVDPTTADFHQGRAPSTPMGIKLCAGVAGTNVVKVLLGRGDVIAAPYALHFDAYRNQLRKTWRPWGNRGLLQRLKCRAVRQLVS